MIYFCFKFGEKYIKYVIDNATLIESSFVFV